MSRYTDLMKKNRRTLKEEKELFALVLEEFDREERRLGKLPIDENTRQESLWNVIDAHWDIIKNRFEMDEENLRIPVDGSQLEDRMRKEYGKLLDYKRKQQKDDVPEEFDVGNIKTGVENLEPEEEKKPVDPKNDKTPVMLDEDTRQFLDISKTSVIHEGDLVDAKNQLTLKKSDYEYSVAGDKTITPEQRKALYQFHHWMRKHNATAKLKWSGFGYKGSAVDFSERFMRLPARVQLKALYLVETDNRKRPNEEIDNAVSQEYVPDYDKLKKKMTSNFLFARKYLNGSRYFWNKLEQAAALANDEKSVKKLKQFTDAKNADKKVKPSDFFFSRDDGLDFLKQLRTQVDQEMLDLEHDPKDDKSKKQRKEELEERKAALWDYTLLVKSIFRLTEFKEEQMAKNSGSLTPEAQKTLESILKSIENVRKNLAQNKKFLEDYQNYFNKQSGDIVGYTGLGTGLGTTIYKLVTEETAPSYIGGSVGLATISTTLLNCIDAVRTMFNGDDAFEKTVGFVNLLTGITSIGSKGITVAKMVTELGTTATNVGRYLGTGVSGVSTIVNAAKSIHSHGKKKKADSLYKSFQVLDGELKKTIDQLSKDPKNEKIVEELKVMKKRTLWKTLDHASKLIKKDKKREHRSNLRKLAASALSCISGAVGYVGNTVLSWCGVGGSGLGGAGGAINSMRDNVLEKRRSKEYIETEYPITNEQRIVAIQNFKKQQQKYPEGSKEWNEIREILSDKKKLDNRIRNMQAGNRVRANQEGLRNAIYQQYRKTIADEASQFKPFKDDGFIQDNFEKNISAEEDQKEKDSLIAMYENRARQLMIGYSDLLNLKKKEEKKAEKKVEKKTAKADAEAGKPSVKPVIG